MRVLTGVLQSLRLDAVRYAGRAGACARPNCLSSHHDDLPLSVDQNLELVAVQAHALAAERDEAPAACLRANAHEDRRGIRHVRLLREDQTRPALIEHDGLNLAREERLDFAEVLVQFGDLGGSRRGMASPAESD